MIACNIYSRLTIPVSTIHICLRYGSYYIHTLVNVDVLYPGLKSLLETVGISVQGQSNHSLRTAIDQRGEQTINKDAKTNCTYVRIFKIKCMFHTRSLEIYINGV